MASRNFPNDYFAWFNDDQRIGILCLDTTSTDTSERTTERYDTFQGDGNLSGTITDLDGSGTTATATSSSHGLATNDRITISGTTTYDGDYTITVTNANTFTFSHSGSTSNETGSWSSLFVDQGLRITYKSHYETVTATTEDLETDIGLDTSLHPALISYVKFRIYEDQDAFEKVGYFKSEYEKSIMKQRSRKSGVRVLSVPKL
tara:strand:- start:2387 stop:2998 length:612 start_codon:yes stop_codon:yes gene_type:complete